MCYPNNILSIIDFLKFVCLFFCARKVENTMETISKVKRRPSEWEEVRANKAADQEIISKI